MMEEQLQEIKALLREQTKVAQTLSDRLLKLETILAQVSLVRIEKDNAILHEKVSNIARVWAVVSGGIAALVTSLATGLFR